MATNDGRGIIAAGPSVGYHEWGAVRSPYFLEILHGSKTIGGKSDSPYVESSKKSTDCVDGRLFLRLRLAE
jgi:hypothetical protein